MWVSNIVPQLRTTDLTGSIRFYTMQLGFALEFEHQDAYAAVSVGGHIVHLKLVDAADPSIARVERAGHFDLYIEVVDIITAAEQLRRNGVVFEQDVHETPWGSRVLVIKDDQGHTLYFGQPE